MEMRITNHEDHDHDGRSMTTITAKNMVMVAADRVIGEDEQVSSIISRRPHSLFLKKDLTAAQIKSCPRSLEENHQPPSATRKKV